MENASQYVLKFFQSSSLPRCLQQWQNNKFAWLICRVKSLICKCFFFFLLSRSFFSGEKKGLGENVKNKFFDMLHKNLASLEIPEIFATYDDCLRECAKKEKFYVVSACAVHHLVLKRSFAYFDNKQRNSFPSLLLHFRLFFS